MIPSEAPRQGGTLPPPEWTSAGAAARVSVPPPAPLPRRTGTRAEEAWLRARVEEARAAADTTGLRAASKALARWLASRERNLDEAVDLATTALSLGVDGELRREVSAWLESLGEAARAAGVLRPLTTAIEGEESEAAYLLVRAGVLKARAGAAAGAAAAFEAAMSIDSDDPLAAELFAGLSGWDPDAVPPSMAADAYVEAARRHALRGHADAELEDLWRALSACPENELAARSVAATLELNDRPEAADEVWRSFAAAVGTSDEPRASATQSRRRAAAEAAADPLRGLAVALDAHTDATLDPVASAAFDKLLIGLGLADVVAARLEVRAERTENGVERLEEGDLRGAAARSWARAALSDDPRQHATVLERMASMVPPPVRAVLQAAAADRYRAAGERSAARRAAEAAVHSDPRSARAAVALAEAAVGDRDAAAAAALERAIAIVGPRFEWCAALADAREALGDSEAAVASSQRFVTIRPSDRRAIDTLLERLMRLRDPARLGDALAWLLSQPMPLDLVATSFARALRDLARVDDGRAAIVARRALDVFGPKSPVVRDAMLEVAGRASDIAFTAAIYERWLACGADGVDRRRLYVVLAERFKRLGDDEGEARIVARALRESVSSSELEAHLEELSGRPLPPDAQLWRMEATALRAARGTNAEALAWAWRDWGAGLWDLADDRVGAIAAWRRAARSARSNGYAALAIDLVTFGGAEFAFAYLERLVEAEADDASAASIAAEVARAALWLGETDIAFEFGAAGVGRCPWYGPALEAAEVATARRRDHGALSVLYEQIARRALGRFGHRAAHYRAARYFEREGESALALDHAARAFRALPSQGSSLQLLARTAERAGDPGRAVRAIEQVADGARPSDARAAWLLRAASVAGEGPESGRRRVDLLLRAVVASPTAGALGLLTDAAADLVRAEADERDALEIRFARAARSVHERLSGPEGARIALAFARAAFDIFDDAESALSSFERAVSCDASIDEFGHFEPYAERLAGAVDASVRVAALVRATDAPPGARSAALARILALAAAACDDASAGVAARTVPPPGASESAPEARRDSEGEQQADGADAADENAPETRADRWMEVAERRERRGDPNAAMHAVLEACRLDPGPLGRWSALERLADVLGADETRVSALEHIVARVGPDGRVAAVKRLARAYEQRHELGLAEAAWAQVLEEDPNDEEANQAIEAALAAEDRHAELAEHLGQRAARIGGDPGRREVLRVVRFRRAAILDQRLARVEDACEELTRLLEDSPDHPGALRYLADLLERQGAVARLAAVLLRAAQLEEEPSERAQLEARAARATLAAGDPENALRLAKQALARDPDSREAGDVWVEAARLLGHDAELGAALDALAAGTNLSALARSDLLVEAAIVAARTGDIEGAVERSRRAAAVAPDRATPQLLARGLEYRIRGAGSPEEATRTIGQLAAIQGPVAPDDSALRAFLTAEAVDVVRGRGEGLRELEAVRASLGDHPLVALGLAERYAAKGQYGAAIDSYRSALAGSLLDLRKPGRVALAAADAATKAMRPADAAYFLEIAERDDTVRAIARAARATPFRPRSTGAPSALASEPLAGNPRSELDLEHEARNGATAADRVRARLALGRRRREAGDRREAEALFWDALAEGSAEAGDLLAALFTGAADRTRDLLRVRLQLVGLEPGDVGRLEALRAAAHAEDAVVVARAVDHVLRSLDTGAPALPAPPVATLVEHPGLLALLTRPSADAAGEVLALVWEGAMQLFVRDAASYSVTGIERIVPGATSPLGKLYEAAIRILDAPRIPLFVSRAAAGSSSRPSASVAILSPPSVILAGDLREETLEMRYALGYGMSAALPSNVLRMGLPPAEGQALVSAIRAAFGSPDAGRGVDSRAARLAESFWQLVPARAQRRLQQLLSAAPFPEHAELAERARQSGRRVGMFVCGDFAFAARELLGESPRLAGHPLSLANLRALCQAEPPLADLLRLAVSPEYAEARWNVAGSVGLRGLAQAGRFTLS
jgi:tetratricopeptide (TPR) repeat protein